jgi:hypothetical protein
MAKLRVLQEDPEAAAKVFAAMTDGGEEEWPKATLPRLAKRWGMPKGAFVEWFTTEHAGVYEAALKVIAADLAVKAMEAAIEATPEDVAVRRLQAETAMKLASRFDRARYGEDRGRDTATVVIADAGLLGEAGALLERLAGPKLLKDVTDAG